MKRPHLLRVERGAGAFAALVEAAREAGLRVGWLDLESPVSIPEGLAEAAALPVLRAVSARPEATVAVKPRRGAPVLDDLLREHFLGCALVLVHGPAEAPLLAPANDAWLLAGARLSTPDLVLRLKAPTI